jgi:uncharacterized SAM-binding protein YcdF (DUF218 family)
LFLIRFAYNATKSLLSSIAVLMLMTVYLCLYTTFPAELFQKLKVAPVLHKADVIVVLGAGVNKTGWPNRFSMERTVKAVILYKKGYANKIIFSGGWAHDGYPAAAVAMGNIAKDLGVKPFDIIIEDKSKDTYQNAQLTAEILKARNYKSMILVTSDSHMRRSMAVFQKLKMPVYPVPVEDEVVTDVKASVKSKIHNISILYQVLYEAAGILKYKQNGWI